MMKKYYTTCFFLRTCLKSMVLILSITAFMTSSLQADETAPPAASSSTKHHEDPFYDFQSLETKAEDTSRDFYSEFFHMLFILGIVIAILILLTWVLKRMQNARLMSSNRDSLIKVLEARPLSPKSSLYFVEILGKGILIGESHAGLVRLGELPLDTDETSDETSE